MSESKLFAAIKLRFVIFIIFSIIIINISTVKSLNIEALHEYMTEPELAYYFNAGDKSSVPDYEIVYLPAVVPIREAISESGEAGEVNYFFKAFGR